MNPTIPPVFSFSFSFSFYCIFFLVSHNNTKMLAYIQKQLTMLQIYALPWTNKLQQVQYSHGLMSKGPRMLQISEKSNYI
jgi:hypothetical protein